MNCITIVNYSVLVNESIGVAFTPSRGLRQGNPLSPYMFLLCAEGFSSPMDQATLQRDLQGLWVIRGEKNQSHSIADDYVLFERTSKEEWSKMQDILSIYEKGLRQVLNNEKSFIIFSPQTKAQDKKFSHLGYWKFDLTYLSLFLGCQLWSKSLSITCLGVLKRKCGKWLIVGSIIFYFKLVKRFLSKMFFKLFWFTPWVV